MVSVVYTQSIVNREGERARRRVHRERMYTFKWEKEHQLASGILRSAAAQSGAHTTQ